MTYSSFSCSKTASGKIRVISHCLMFSAKTIHSSTLKEQMAEVWLLSDVLHQLKLRLATLSGGAMKGVLENSFSKTRRDTMNTTDKSLGCLHLRLCFFLTKVARILIRYKEKTLIKFSGLQLEQSTFNCYFSVKEISQDARILAGVGIGKMRMPDAALLSTWAIAVVRQEWTERFPSWALRQAGCFSDGGREGTWASYLLTELSEEMLATGNPTFLFLREKGWGGWQEEHK